VETFQKAAPDGMEVFDGHMRYKFLTRYGAKPAVSFKEIEKVLERFNAIRESGGNSPAKIGMLQETINKYIQDGKIKPEKDKIISTDAKINFSENDLDQYNEPPRRTGRNILADSLVKRKIILEYVCQEVLYANPFSHDLLFIGTATSCICSRCFKY
jgi:hypothetical protein